MPTRALETGPAGQSAAHAIERTRATRGSRIELTVRRCDIGDLLAIAAILGPPPHILLADPLVHPESVGAGAT
ncbi:XRE family transcriptional regulator [Streptomyces halstedii]|uniref:XRE family transcriptional regulator n=1 Tax=Streptomyces halstedii TaxID=1944 RepID=UPI0037CFE87A